MELLTRVDKKEFRGVICLFHQAQVAYRRLVKFAVRLAIVLVIFPNLVIGVDLLHLVDNYKVVHSYTKSKVSDRAAILHLEVHMCLIESQLDSFCALIKCLDCQVVDYGRELY